MIMTNRLVHLELHTTDLARACAFYERVCGWRPEQVHAGGGSYTAMEIGGHVGGGVVECGTEKSVWLPYVAVDDLVEATRRAEALGASVLLPPREGPAGWRSVVTEESGAELAFWQAKRVKRK
jgi:predicted enzyme related to lactoylglutathione lyase